jgi:hypothetical protein
LRSWRRGHLLDLSVELAALLVVESELRKRLLRCSGACTAGGSQSGTGLTLLKRLTRAEAREEPILKRKIFVQNGDFSGPLRERAPARGEEAPGDEKSLLSPVEAERYRDCYRPTMGKTRRGETFGKPVGRRGNARR